ncbi:MAG: M24 family metallopeptidase [Ilumatobacteraceae bacterium]
MTSRPSRLAGLRDRCAVAGVDTLVVSDLTNIRWLTGFTGSNGVAVVSASGVALLTDGRYGDQARRQLGEAGIDASVTVSSSSADLLRDLVAACGRCSGTVGIEADHVTVSTHQRWVAALGHDVQPTSGLVEVGRRAKDDDEVVAMSRACSIADRALAGVAPMLQSGLTETAVRNALETTMRELGATGPSYETIVASGPRHAALPHHRPVDRRLEDGDLVIIDVGALVDGYHSDMTRTFVVGVPTQEQLDAYHLVLEAQAAGLAAVGPGVPARAVDEACRAVIARAGRADWFTHGTGHGVGLLIHEEPYLNRTSEAVLRPGDVVTVEPGVYREGFGGIRIEDLVLVTADGCRPLTATPKDSPCPPSPPMT